jgi:subtilisin family serine protease
VTAGIRIRRLSIAGLIAAALVAATGVRTGAQQAPPVASAARVDGEIIVRFDAQLSADEVAVRAAVFGAQIARKLDAVDGLYLLNAPPGAAIDSLAADFMRLPGVAYAEPNFLMYSDATPNDPSFATLWGLHNTGQSGSDGIGAADSDIDAPEAWNITTGSSDVVVAVIDTGIDYTHPDLAANMFRNESDCNANTLDDDGNGYADDCYGIDTANNDSNPMDDQYHGTHVAGTIGAAGNNGIGVTGVNWHVRIMACKFLNSSGSGSTADAIDCLNYVRMMKDRGVNIVATNNSWGGGPFSQALHDAILAQQQRGILFIAAAGNTASNNDVVANYPSNYDLPNVIAVASTTRTDALSSFSSMGRRTVHLAAPGSFIFSTMPGGAYGTLSGTSMATPHVTGVAALIKAQDPNRDWRAIRNLLIAGGDVTAGATGKTISGRRLNANGSLTCAGTEVFSRLTPIDNAVAAGAGQPVILKALNINCDHPNGTVSVAVSGGVPAVTLLDDGVLPDLAAGDGIYTAVFVPTASSYTLTFPGGDVVSLEAGNAIYDSSSRAPRCYSSGPRCSTGGLVDGRASIAGGAELHQPNTINATCPDGPYGVYHNDESIDALAVSTLDGSTIAPYKTVRIDATVFAYSTSDRLDIFYSPGPTGYVWYYLTTLTPAAPGAQTLSTTMTVPPGPVQGIRANFRYFGSVSACSTGAYDDHDDLIFSTVRPFTDEPLASGVAIKAAHIEELRDRIDAARVVRGLSKFPYTDPVLTAGGTTIKAVHITELRTALSDAYAAAGRIPPSFTYPAPAAGLFVRAAHIAELRAAVIAIE